VYRSVSVMCLIVWCGCSVTLAQEGNEPRAKTVLPPLETVILEPVELENIVIWVPASKIGPIINRSCRPRKNCSISCVLPADVRHTKSASCPSEVARLLAEYTARYYEESLPLTILDGWQWEYSFSLCQYDALTYELPARGGSWESVLEAVLSLSEGTIGLHWLEMPEGEAPPKAVQNDGPKSSIEVCAFNAMRIRDGYPKMRLFQ
jgi:hypothetical protein